MTTPAVPAVTVKPVAEIGELISALENASKSTFSTADDLKGYEYVRESEYGQLRRDGQSLQLSELALRQLCRHIHVPYSTFKGASTKLANDMFQEFVGAKKDEERQRKFCLRKAGNTQILRGLLPIEYTDTRNVDLLRPFVDQSGFVVQHAPWMDKADEPFITTRLIHKDLMLQTKTSEGKEETLYLGMELSSSELGEGPMMVGIVLFRPVCSNGAISLYGSYPYFYYDYGGTLQISDFSQVTATVQRRLEADVPLFWGRVQEAMDTPWKLTDTEEALSRMQANGRLNKGVSVKVARYLEQNPPTSQWDFVNAITNQAQTYRGVLRQRYELAAARTMNLVFDRSKSEPDWLVTVKKKEKPAPPANGQSTATVPAAVQTITTQASA
jgi:hypothetical protein